MASYPDSGDGSSEPMTCTIIRCTECGQEFPSKTKLFKHLESHGVAAEPAEAREKAALLVGWLLPLSSSQVVEQPDPYKVDVITSLLEAIRVVDGVQSSDCDTGVFAASGVGSSSGQNVVMQADLDFHALADVWVVDVKKIADDALSQVMDEWVMRVNQFLHTKNKPILVHQRMKPPVKSFDPEKQCSQRIYDLLLPLHALMPSKNTPVGEAAHQALTQHASKVVQAKGARMRDSATYSVNKKQWSGNEGASSILDPWQLEFFGALKQILKYFSNEYRSWHNFVKGGGCPNEPAVCKRIDRIHHTGIVKLEGELFVLLRISGDTFLRGQIQRVLGLILALSRGWLPLTCLEIALSDDIFDVPAVPGWLMYLGECKYERWETKHHFVLDPRRRERLLTMVIGKKSKDEGRIVVGDSSDPEAVVKRLAKVELSLLEWELRVQKHIVESLRHSEATGQNQTDWLCEFQRACSYQLDKFNRVAALRTRQLDPAIPSSAPVAYAKVLQLLRQADASGQWPASTAARERLLSSSAGEGKPEDQTVGSGTFSIGIMPCQMANPRCNALFPELLRACFQLERALKPDRPPSATIAVNRHAQFRPHRDSGAGAGQTTSLIVALGDFVGGELVAEGETYDIRYNPLEFDGWKQRHWTLPFAGERYSLVWFTPLGIERSQLWWLDDLE